MRLGWIVALASGCTWITDADLAARKAEVDDDGDGVPKAKDCNDNDPDIAPTAAEAWYDGVDQACDKGDDYDQDGDGFVPDAYVGLPTAGVEGSGALPGGDCDDSDPLVSPGQPDQWYDGIDSDCDGADDYDKDGDGYVDSINAGKETRYVEGSGHLPGGDCDDDNLQVHPGAANDAWYDGIDTDCAGDDDFDQDGDGYVPTSFIGHTTRYVEVSGTLPGGDCNDLDAEINPGVMETFYNGVDEACDLGDDYDQDLDGYVADDHVGLATVTGSPDDEGNYATVAGSGSLAGGDCDDLDTTRHPRAVEVLDDLVDQDCDGGLDSVGAYPMIGYTYEDPASPTFVEANGFVYLALSAATIERPTGEPYVESGFGLRWARSDLRNDPDAVSEVPWAVQTGVASRVVTGPIDARASEDYLFGAVAVEIASGARVLAVVGYPLAGADGGSASPQGDIDLPPFDDVGLWVSSNWEVDVVGCNGGDSPTLTFVGIDDIEGATTYSRFETDTSGAVGGTSCDLYSRRGEDAVAYAFDNVSGGLHVTTFDPTLSSPVFTDVSTSTFSPADIDVISALSDSHPVVVAAQPDSGVLLWNYGLDESAEILAAPVRATAATDYSDAYVVAWVDAAGDAFLAWPDGAGGWSTTAVTCAFDAEAIAVFSTEDRYIVAVTGSGAPGNVGIGVIAR